ncbi:ammonium transporter [Spirulina major]|uniref:ammonium transporter n=1 Tax=Spirulina major TaxID=270636 RepID=UPI003CCBAA11
MMSKSTLVNSFSARERRERAAAGNLKPVQQLLRWFSPYWIACIPLVAIILVVWDSAAFAQHALDLDELDFADPEVIKGTLDTVFILASAILVIFMNAGFAMLEAGFCRQKNAVNVLAKNLIVFGIAAIAYWAIGFAFMYGQGNGFIGSTGFFLLSEDPADYGLDPFPAGLPISASFLFQVAFAATAATIVSGAVAERIHFVSFLIFAFLLVSVSYPITGHWVWAGGWLSEAGFSDFAGSTVVHSVGGWAALMGAAFLGPRIGKYNDSGINAIPGHNMSIATLGCLVLWVGWYGFNPGSELAASPNITYIALTTTLAAAAGGVAATATSWLKDGKPDLSMVINGILAGLVGITAGCNAIPYTGSVITGAIAGVIVVFSVSIFDSLHIDDPVGATSVHLVCGIWGTLAVAIFGGGNFGAQVIGILAIGGFTVVFSSIVWLALKFTIGIRVSPEDELQGLDISEHGMEAYNGFVTETDTFASGQAMGISGSSEA